MWALQGLLIYLTLLGLVLVFIQASKYSNDRSNGKASREQLRTIQATLITTIIIAMLAAYALTK